MQFFLAVIVKTEYGIPVVFAQSRQDTMSGYYPTNFTNYGPGRNNLTREGGQLSRRDFEIGFNNMFTCIDDLNSSSFYNV